MAIFAAQNRNQRNPWHSTFAADASHDIHARVLALKAIIAFSCGSDRLVLGALPHYSLDCELPSRVDGEKAAAKFVKKTKTLRVTIPLA
jgi:hypothetical protein